MLVADWHMFIYSIESYGFQEAVMA